MTWNSIPLGDIALQRGGSVDPKKHQDEVFELYSIPAFDAGAPEIASGSEIGSSKKEVQTNDVMLSRIVPHIRRAWVVGSANGKRQIASGEWIVFRSDGIWPPYLRWVLVGDEFHSVFMRTVSGVGGSLLRARPAEVFKIKVPLPPLAEQKRIAAILDAADALRAKRRESLAQLDRLLQSTFLELFGDPVTNPKGWTQGLVGDVVHFAKDGPHVSPKYADSGIPFLSARHIKPGEVIWDDLKYIDQEEAERQWTKCKPELGDILYTKGGTTGIAARVRTSEPFAVWVHVALLRPIANKVNNVWLESMLNSHYCYVQSQRYTHGIANRDLGLTRMVKIKILLPPLAEQNHFATIVESIERQKTRLRAHLAELDNLFASLQSRAFNGQL
ncbi:MAG: restriction endonuclease subunit S [Lamprobacter sp.]|uniref:restriction endonuclease subunit S n=1 Tax=Lamprobacter sp. TaxID=3100796 RepID=UPI002B25AB41|nr:restriction endonuclease subunit S [Lamprobacter sp.]MEA3642168.1 restriction endonuclease subunit S [Lamprobacter sp.]